MVKVKIYEDGNLLHESEGKAVFFAVAPPVGRESDAGIIGKTNITEITKVVADAASGILAEMADSIGEAVNVSAAFVDTAKEKSAAHILEKFINF